MHIRVYIYGYIHICTYIYFLFSMSTYCHPEYTAAINCGEQWRCFWDLRENRVVITFLITVSEKYPNSFERLGTVYPSAQRHIPRTLNIELHRSDNRISQCFSIYSYRKLLMHVRKFLLRSHKRFQWRTACCGCQSRIPCDSPCHGGNRLINPSRRSLTQETLLSNFASLILPHKVAFRYSTFVTTLRATECCRWQI
jgi:hypothetical protein